MKFSGAVYDPAKDDERLEKQLGRVWNVMRDGHWRTLFEIADMTGDPEASISAQLRHMRKPSFGSYVVNKRPRGGRHKGLFEYQLLAPTEESPDGLSPPGTAESLGDF